jgi:hypothetical protein
MSEPEEMITWATSAGTGTVGYSQSVGSNVSSPTWTTSTTPWAAGADPEMVKAWMNAIIDHIEQLQLQIKQLEARQDG